jgi:hypothetical protein
VAARSRTATETLREPELTVSHSGPRSIFEDFFGPVIEDRTPVRDPRFPPRRPRRFATATLAIIALAAVAVGLGLWAVLSGGSSGKSYTYTFAPETYPESGLTVTRTWKLSGGDYPALHATLSFHASKSVSTSVEEVFPQSLAANVRDVSFQPQPKTIGEDPLIVAYDVRAAADQTITATYDIPVDFADVSMASLTNWADDQRREVGTRYRQSHSVHEISFQAKSISLRVGESKRLRLDGVDAAGRPVPSIAITDAAYRISDPSIATVSDDGLITAKRPGQTQIVATLDDLRASATVKTIAAAKPTPAAGKARTDPSSAPGAKESANSDGTTGSSSTGSTGSTRGGNSTTSGQTKHSTKPATHSTSPKGTKSSTPAKPKPTQSTPPATKPPVTQPPVTQPPVTNPPVTQPPVTQPPVTNPPVTQPPVTQPPVTNPPVTQPPVTQPPVTQPPVTEPPATNPPVTQPPATVLP